jgi:hypothetical protein
MNKFKFLSLDKNKCFKRLDNLKHTTYLCIAIQQNALDFIEKSNAFYGSNEMIYRFL